MALDPGHNGRNGLHPRLISTLVEAGGFRKACNTTGTAADSGYTESAFNFDLAQRTAAVLRRLGAVVVLTRDSDTGVGPCVDRRPRLAVEAGADVLVSLHADGGPPQAAGFHVAEPGLAPDGGNRDVLVDSRRLAGAVHAALVAADHVPATYPDHLVAAGRTRRSDLAGLNLSRVPVVLVECGNMRNREDALDLQDPVWRQRTAEALAEGITAHLSPTTA